MPLMCFKWPEGFSEPTTTWRGSTTAKAGGRLQGRWQSIRNLLQMGGLCFYTSQIHWITGLTEELFQTAEVF